MHICKIIRNFVADLILYTMRIRIPALALLFIALPLLAEVHITINEPAATWTAQKALGNYIGQTVIFDVPLVVCSNENGNIKVSPWRAFQPQSQGFIGSDGYTTAAHINNTCRFSLTGLSGYHRCGEKIYGLKARVNSTNSLAFIEGEWRGNTRADLEAALPELGDYRLLVCAMNLENYFVRNLGPSYLGPDSYAEHQKQRTKVRKALAQINADIFGLVELEEGDDAVEEIVSDLNNAHPERNYKFFRDPSSGSNQKSDYVYDANTVEPIGFPVEINTELVNRKKMLCFREKATGEKFIYSINHFKAMNTGDEARRVREATAVMDIYKSYRSNPSVHDKDALFMGDLNCYAFTDPIAVFTKHDMIDLHRAHHADSSYSYMYSSLASYIDHALCNETMYPQITGMAAYHINSDEDDRYNYERSSDNTMFRCSDHDPVLVGLKLDSTLIYDPSPQINSAEVFRGNANQLVIRNAHSDGQQSYYAIYTVNGWLVERKEIESAYYEVNLPSTPGTYIVYIYYDGQAYQRRLIVR